MDMMNSVYGELIGGWIGRYIHTDVDEDGIAWGKDLRIRVAVRVDQPLVRGVPLKSSTEDEDSNWFDLKYEKVPHFCFDCGRLVHSDEGCSAEKADVQQWGEWLRASPGRSHKPPPQARPSRSSGSYNYSRSTDSGMRGREGVSIRDVPPRRNMGFDRSSSSFSHTGGRGAREEERDVTSPDKHQEVGSVSVRNGKEATMADQRKRHGTYVRRQWSGLKLQETDNKLLPPGGVNKKRTKQVWVQVPVTVIGEGSSESAGKRQRTTSVFDRLEDPATDPARQGRRGQ
jgi:hypothetical protein